MLTTPRQSTAEGHANQGFAALMQALARPGHVQTLPEPGEGAVIAALIDRECRVHAVDPLLIPALLETGAEIAELPRADHLFAGELRDLDALSGLNMGSDLYPDEGATLIIRGQIGSGPVLRLTGPGIETEAELALGNVPEGFWRFRAEAARYPMGFELFVIDGARVIGIPRSTRVEVR